jgi:hypothetical protein
MRFIPAVTVLAASLFFATSASAQQAYWVDSSGEGRGEAQLEAAKEYCVHEASQVYRDYISEQERTYGQARNALVVIARAAFADKLQEKAFYGCMRQDGWTFVNR